MSKRIPRPHDESTDISSVTIVSLNSYIRELKITNESLQSAIEHLKEQNEYEQTRFRNLHIKMNRIQREYENTIKRLNNDIDTYIVLVDELRSTSTSTKSESKCVDHCNVFELCKSLDTKNLNCWHHLMFTLGKTKVVCKFGEKCNKNHTFCSIFLTYKSNEISVKKSSVKKSYVKKSFVKKKIGRGSGAGTGTS